MKFLYEALARIALGTKLRSSSTQLHCEHRLHLNNAKASFIIAFGLHDGCMVLPIEVGPLTLRPL